jgi:hypothetical protein
MLKDIVEVQVLSDHHLYLRFEDGVEGDVDVAKMISFHGIFEPLQNQMIFQQVQIDKELGCITWPNGADIDPDVLYATITHQSLEALGTLS